jgi:hypothetical protein
MTNMCSSKFLKPSLEFGGASCVVKMTRSYVLSNAASLTGRYLWSIFLLVYI